MNHLRDTKKWAHSHGGATPVRLPAAFHRGLLVGSQLADESKPVTGREWLANLRKMTQGYHPEWPLYEHFRYLYHRWNVSAAQTVGNAAEPKAHRNRHQVMHVFRTRFRDRLCEHFRELGRNY